MRGGGPDAPSRGRQGWPPGSQLEKCLPPITDERSGLGVDVVFRLHQRRHYDFRRGRRLGPGDHVVVWAKPERPDWMDRETYALLPDQLTVREVRFRVETPGARSEEVVAATTLCDAARHSKDDIADLYHRRWQVELDIRARRRCVAEPRSIASWQGLRAAVSIG